ncbi:MAG: FAD binding domain-containing protein [Acidimicrobiia bacterium]
MQMITHYHRPPTLDDAIALVARPDAAVLAGGTSVNAAPDRAASTAVDLQALDLDGIDVDGDGVRIGATTRLQDLVESGLIPTVLRDLARREAPSTIRAMATVGGTIGNADPESELLAGLLAFGARVTLARAGSPTEHSLDDVLSDKGLLNGSIITAVTVPTSGEAAADRVARTPMDRPIVMAVAYHDGDITRLAMTGVASVPVVVDPDHIDDLTPPPDFRGTAAYRVDLAEVLAARVLAAVEGGASA